jgi:hypothetical protein
MRRRLELMLLISKLTMIPRIYERLLMRAYNIEPFLASMRSLKSKSLHRLILTLPACYLCRRVTGLSILCLPEASGICVRCRLHDLEYSELTTCHLFVAR